MSIYTARATNANFVDADISIDSSDFSPGGGTSAEEKAIAQLALDVQLWLDDTLVSTNAPPP